MRCCSGAGVALAALLLAACSAPARYVVVTDDGAPAPLDREQRLVFLASGEARAHPGILRLRDRSGVERYGRERPAGAGPLEQVLFQLVSRQYAAAEQTLRAHGAELPDYLRPLLAADLASEREAPELPTSELLRLYQAAYDAQDNPMARAIIELRIRQLRYQR